MISQSYSGKKGGEFGNTGLAGNAELLGEVARGEGAGLLKKSGLSVKVGLLGKLEAYDGLLRDIGLAVNVELSFRASMECVLDGILGEEGAVKLWGVWGRPLGLGGISMISMTSS
jgi:hypothetical protein